MENVAVRGVLTPQELLEHWQGHRGLTRRVIEAFPEKELFNFSVGGMRPFAVLVMEMLDIAGPGMHGFVTGKWDDINAMPHATGKGMPETKEALLALWDEITEVINRLWPELKPEKFQEKVLAFGQFEGTLTSSLLYFIDNEIHHRGQGYVYLRALGIAPPPFWDR
ncbi:DinB family protein [Flavobacterium sp. MK4S-17]|uniref:DinB family protein n=1 Tax=Flavobacterium sp. MK4S-17 TaxID=2543737 RepID=UPI001356C51F|nr:DinB family protein [Flavobacterium sp. MK4S-17]